MSEVLVGLGLAENAAAWNLETSGEPEVMVGIGIDKSYDSYKASPLKNPKARTSPKIQRLFLQKVKLF